MWKKLSSIQKGKYKKLITNFASLSEAFAQKEDDSKTVVMPIVNSKFQETAFQYAFNATVEDIGNTSYDASIDNKEIKYLVGIKTFGYTSKDQKIAQFKSISPNWTDMIDRIVENSKNLKTKEEIDRVNKDLYLKLAKEIAYVRNLRIDSSEENLRGFKLNDTDTLAEIKAVYHVLMPSRKNDIPQIFVGETSYTKIDIDKITVVGKGLGSTGVPNNFKFSDGIHTYKYTSSDSQLYMNFDNENIIVEKWPISYVKDALSIFENLNNKVVKRRQALETHSMYIKIEQYSGFNAFNAQSKMGRGKNNQNRKKYVEKVKTKFIDTLTLEQADNIFPKLEYILYNKWNSSVARDKMARLRKELLEYVYGINKELYCEIEKNLYRTVNEFELRIPNSKKFHEMYPDFFVKHPFERDKKGRTFKLKFVPSDTVIDGYLCEDNLKAIKSAKKEKYLGAWVRNDIFRLARRELLTKRKAQELGINGFRLSKYEDCITLEFIWIDPSNEPKDLWR